MDVSYARDLVEFLQHPQSAAQAAELLLSLSGSAFFLQLCRDDSDYATSLAKACGRTLTTEGLTAFAEASRPASRQAEVARRCVAQACVNLAQIETFYDALEQAGVVRKVVEAMRSADIGGDTALMHAALKLLVNLTRTGEGQLQFLRGGSPSAAPQGFTNRANASNQEQEAQTREAPTKEASTREISSSEAPADYLAEITTDLLLRRYFASVEQHKVAHSVVDLPEANDSVYDTIPLIFVNLSCQEAGRKLLLGSSEDDRVARCSKFAEAALSRPLQRPELLQLLLHLALSSECHSCLTDERCRVLEILLRLGKSGSSEERKKVLLILQALTRSTTGVLALLNHKVVQVLTEEWPTAAAAESDVTLSVNQLKANLGQYSIVDDPSCLPLDIPIEGPTDK